MPEVYFYLPVNEVENAVECGLKLSRWYNREVSINGEEKKCIAALLSPKDDMESYRSSNLKCIKLELPSKYCYIADRYLYVVGQQFQEAMRMYLSSITPVENYAFGSYRLPECLVTTTALTGQVSVLGKRLDSPVLFESSEELYINNVVESFKEEHDDFTDCLLYNFYSKLAEIGKADKIEDNDKNVAIFFDKKRKKSVAVKIPDLTGY